MPKSYARYVQYVFSRYQANNCILSPIHYDWSSMTIPSREYLEPIQVMLDRYGPPPFGTLLSTNADGSTLLNFDQAPWITMHQVGNRRDHDVCWHLTEIYQECDPPRPALNGEPYYAGWPPNLAAEGGSPEDDMYCRAAMYGSFLAGGFAGHILWAVNSDGSVSHLSHFGTSRLGDGIGRLDDEGNLSLSVRFSDEPEGSYRIYRYNWVSADEYHMMSRQYADDGTPTGNWYGGYFVRVAEGAE